MGATLFYFISSEQIFAIFTKFLEQLLQRRDQSCVSLSNQSRGATPSAVPFSRPSSAPVSGELAPTVLVLNEWQLTLLWKCRHALRTLHALAELHFRPSQRRSMDVRAAKSSIELSTEEVLHLTRMDALMQLSEGTLPARYLAAAVVSNFGGCLAASCVVRTEPELLSLLYESVAQSGLAVPQSTEVPWYSVLQESAADLYHFRSYDFNKYPSAYSAVMSVAVIWEYNKKVLPVLVDPHRQVSKIWLSRFPNSLVVAYNDDAAENVLRIAALTGIILIVDRVPPNSTNSLQSFLTHAATVVSSSETHHNFRLLFNTVSAPAWLSDAAHVLVQCQTLDEPTGVNLCHKVLSHMIQPQTYHLYAEHCLALAETKSRREDAFQRLLSAAVDPTPSAKSLVASAQREVDELDAGVEELTVSVHSAAAQRHVYLAVAHVAFRLYVVERAEDSEATLHGVLTEIVLPAVQQHLTEGLRHFTKQKGEVVLRFSGWLRSAIASSQEHATEQQQSGVPESHNSISLCCHCVRRYVLANSTTSTAAAQQMHRRLVRIWSAQQRGIIPLDLLHFAASVASSLSQASEPRTGGAMGAADDDEIELLKRFQRLLMTIASMTTLLQEDVTARTTTAVFREWDAHAKGMAAERFASLENDTFRYMAAAICRLQAPVTTLTPALCQPVALAASVVEVWRVWGELRHTLLVEVPKRRAMAAVLLVPEFHRQCLELEAKARAVKQRVSPVSGGTDDINQLLLEREQVKEMAREKRDLLNAIPNDVCPTPMPTVDFLVEKCLPK